MYHYRRIIAGVLFATASFTVSAGDAFRFGLLPTMSAYQVTDPDGTTDSATGFTPLSVVMLAEVGRDSRLMLHSAYESFSLNHSVTNIGQDVTNIRGDLSYQMLVRITRGWKPWFGAGLSYANETYKDRYVLTPGGFQGTRYPDRTKSDFGVVLNLSSAWVVNKDWDMGVHLQLEQPTGSNGLRVVRLGLYAVY